MSGDVIDLTPKAATDGFVLRERGLDARLFDAAANVTRTNVIAVVGPQGGAGKTRITFALGSALAQLAGLNVIAMDLDDDYGALLDLVPERTRNSRTLSSLADGDGSVSFPRLRACLSVTRSRMLVLRGPEETGELAVLLTRLANADVVLLDCAAGVTRPRCRWALEQADQVVVVARSEGQGSGNAAAATERALRDVSAAGCLVINRRRVRMDVSAVERSFASVPSLAGCVHVPESRRLARGFARADFRLDRLGVRTRFAVKDLAAIVGDRLR